MQNRPEREEPRDVEVFLPRSVELLTRERPPEPEAVQYQRMQSRKRVAVWLFLATCVTTFLAGTELHLTLLHPAVLEQLVDKGLLGTVLMNGLTYSAAVMSILLFHEMGHYLQAKRYNVPASLPFFIPMPLPPIGTMGAVIFQGAGVADRKQMFDIAISGPLAGLLLALPAMYFGVMQAEIKTMPPNHAGLAFGDPLIIKWTVEYLHRPLNPGEDVVLTPLLFAGWVGIFITALNLIPIGQLDGGHILYTLIGKRAHVVAIALLMGAVAYMVYSQYYAYSLMVVLLFLMGARHPPTADDSVPLGAVRVILGWLTLAFIIIGFTPTPIINMP
jgi:membrane-associated protease RseP (regulator of RpoE activity)